MIRRPIYISLSVFAAYFLSGWLGLKLQPVGGFATLVWAPSGIALSALLLFGRRYWPAVFLAAFFVNIAQSAPGFVAIGIGIGNTLAAVCGHYLLKHRFDMHNSLDRPRDILALILVGALTASLISSTVGSLSLIAGAIIESHTLLFAWLTWFVGDMVGVLVVVPLVLGWLTRPRLPTVVIGRNWLWRGFGLLFLQLAASVVAFKFNQSYLVFPILIWLALSLGLREVSIGNFITVAVAVWNSAFLYASDGLSFRLLPVQISMAVTVSTILILNTVAVDRKRIIASLARASITKENL